MKIKASFIDGSGTLEFRFARSKHKKPEPHVLNRRNAEDPLCALILSPPRKIGLIIQCDHQCYPDYPRGCLHVFHFVAQIKPEEG